MNSTDRNNCKADDQWDSSEEIEDDDDGGVDVRVCFICLNLLYPYRLYRENSRMTMAMTMVIIVQHVLK
jgi:hypothetical protein